MSGQATTFERQGFLRCEQRGSDVLLLERLPDLATAFNGRRYRHAITYRWLRDPSDRTSVLGSERTFCTCQEAADGVRRGLFEAFRLFP
jgi:hypothetical protein